MLITIEFFIFSKGENGLRKKILKDLLTDKIGHINLNYWYVFF